MKPLHPNLLRTISAVWVSGALALLTGLTDLSDPAPLQAASPEPEEVAKAPAPAAPKELSAKAAEVMRLTESGVVAVPKGTRLED